MMPPLLDHSFPELKDCHLLGQEEDETKLEISLNTVGYKPEELKVNVCKDEVRVEGRHEESNEEGKMMVRRQLVRRYTLPQEADRASIVSNLSQDGVMVKDLPVPMTLRNTFFEDPFFKNTLVNIEKTREDFFKKARQNFEGNIKHMESSIMHSINQESSDLKSKGHWVTPKN